MRSCSTHRMAPAGILGALLVALGCATVPTHGASSPSPEQRAFARITVFSEGEEAERVAAALREAGYGTVQVSDDVDVDLNLKFGGTDRAVVEHLTSVAARVLGLEAGSFRIEQPWGADDPDVYLNVSSHAACARKPSCTPMDASQLRGLVEVNVFSDVGEGRAAAERLSASGYAHVELRGQPNDSLNIKYGAAPIALVADVLREVAGASGCRVSDFVVRRVFDKGDDDVFVNLGGAAMQKAGCGGAGATPPAESYDVKVLLLSDDGGADALAKRLRGAGYRQLRLSADADLDLAVVHGGVDPERVQEILQASAETLGVAPSAFRVEAGLPEERREVHVHLPAFAVCEAKPGCTPPDTTAARAGARVELRADVPVGDAITRRLEAKGFQKVETLVDPHGQLGVEYGAAPLAVVREVVQAAASQTGCSLGAFSVRRALDPADPRIRLHLPSGGLRDRGCLGRPPEARIVMLVEAPATGRRLRRHLVEGGFSAVDLAELPRPDLQVTFGRDAEVAGEWVRALVADELGVWPSDIALRPDPLVPSGTVFVHIAEARLPPPCRQDEANPDYLGLEVGSTVVPKRHRIIGGRDNFVPAMEAFIGRRAVVRERAGVDGGGCPVVKLDVDSGRYYWRVRDLEPAAGQTSI